MSSRDVGWTKVDAWMKRMLRRPVYRDWVVVLGAVLFGVGLVVTLVVKEALDDGITCEGGPADVGPGCDRFLVRGIVVAGSVGSGVVALGLVLMAVLVRVVARRRGPGGGA